MLIRQKQIENLESDLLSLNDRLNSIVPSNSNIIVTAPDIIFSDDLVANVTNTVEWYEGTTFKQTQYPDDIILSPKPLNDLKRFVYFCVELGSPDDPIVIYAKEGESSLTPVEPSIETYDFVIAKALITNAGAAPVEINKEYVIYLGYGGDDNQPDARTISTRVATADKAIELAELNGIGIISCKDALSYSITSIPDSFDLTFDAPNAEIIFLNPINLSDIDNTLTINCRILSGAKITVSDNATFTLNCDKFTNEIDVSLTGNVIINASEGNSIVMSGFGIEYGNLTANVIKLDTFNYNSSYSNILGTINGILYPQNYELTANKNASNGYAGLTNGLIAINQIPPSALERLVIVANQAARYALTTATVQNGDTVKQTDTGLMYFIKDETNLSNSSGYEIYTAGSAASVPWSGITSIPTPVTNLSGVNTGDQDISGKVDKEIGKSLVLDTDITNFHLPDRIVYTGTSAFSFSQLTFYIETSGEGIAQEFTLASPTTVTGISVYLDAIPSNELVIDIFNGLIVNNRSYGYYTDPYLTNPLVRSIKTVPVSGVNTLNFNTLLPAGNYHFITYRKNPLNSNILLQEVASSVPLLARKFNHVGTDLNCSAGASGGIKYSMTGTIDNSSSAIARTGGIDINGNLIVTSTIAGSNLSGTNTGDNATNSTSNTYADGKVAQTITNGVTTSAPSQDAVFDALALKQPVGTYSTDIHSNITALNAVSGVNTGDQDLTVKVDKIKLKQIHTSGSTVTIDYTKDELIIDPVTVLSSLTITTPLTANLYDGQQFKISYGGTILIGYVVTSLILSGNTSQTIIAGNTIRSAFAGDGYILSWNASTNKWYII